MPELVNGDAIRLTQILLNLASNAVKFTVKGSIAITAALLQELEDTFIIEFAVKDTGIGIPYGRQDNIFLLFEQATNDMTRKFGGTGIGLSVVKQLIDLQQGKISVNSKPGEGSSFYFQLNFKKNTIQDKSKLISAKDMTSFANGVKVLTVEDNEVNQLLVLKLLQKYAYETAIAANGKIAIEKLLEADFDVILMDLQMPEMDGYQATTIIGI